MVAKPAVVLLSVQQQLSLVQTVRVVCRPLFLWDWGGLIAQCATKGMLTSEQATGVWEEYLVSQKPQKTKKNPNPPQPPLKENILFLVMNLRVHFC